MGSSRREGRTRSQSPSQLAAFVRLCEARTDHSFEDHRAFHDFSVVEYRRFWELLLNWSGVLREGSAEPVCTSVECERATFFPNLRLNYAENLLRIDSPSDAERGALVACHAFRAPERLTRGELRARVCAVAMHLREIGVMPGDRVVAVAENNAEVVIAGLATAALGATFSSAAPDMGVPSLVSRFEQLGPTVLVANLVTAREAVPDELAARVGELVRSLPSLRAFVALDGGPPPRDLRIPLYRLPELMDGADDHAFEWVRFPFNHPLFVLFSSGTTGRPKCLVHGTGGTLLEHVKEHRLHIDLRPDERLYFQTSASWMMWNWQLSALATGAEIILYDGPAARPESLWEIVSREHVNVFGTSPPYLQLCQDSGFSPRRRLPLPRLRAVLSTGSILHDWQYDWVSDEVGPLALQSISGGTDLIGCFVLGHPDLPVRRGLIQCRSLGLDVRALPGDSSPPTEGSPVGELVCCNPFPSRPLGFFGDDGQQFHAAYFEQNPGVWTHGDLIEFEPDGQARMHGRSDGVLNVRGVRIGPAEIYRALGGVEEISEAMAVELREPDGEPMIVLLVVLHRPTALDARLVVRIRREIARNASAAHVPELVAEVGELPRTYGGKRSERAGRDAANGRPVAHAEALANPESLDAIRAAVARTVNRRRELSEEAEQPSGGPTEACVRAIWEAILGVRLQPDDNFFELGGTSLAAVRALHAINHRLEIDLPLSIFIQAQTSAKMAALIDAAPEEPVPAVVPMRAGSGGRPLFLMHAVAGGVLGLIPLAQRLDTDRPVYGLQARGLDRLHEPQTSVEEMAGGYAEAIRSVQPHGPYALIGHSFGGMLAFETARRLSAAGGYVEALVLIDADLHHGSLPRPQRWRFRLARPLRFVRHALADPRRRVPVYVRKIARHALPGAAVEPPNPDLPPRMQYVERVGWEAFRAYRPGPYEGSATLFLARVRRPGFCNPLPVWARVVRGGLTVEWIAADHDNIVQEPNVGPLAARVSELLARESQNGAAT